MNSPITATGTKGLLLWMKQEQPGLYQYIAPKLIAAARSAAVLSGFDCLPPMRMGRLGDSYYSYSTSYVSSPSVPSGIVNVPDTSSSLNIASGTTTSTLANGASSSSTSSALAASIAALANGYSAATLTQAQISANNTLLQANLARAQQGLPPLTAAALATGATSLTSNSGLLLLGVAAAAAFMIMGQKKGK
jgi:hypothetical protein